MAIRLVTEDIFDQQFKWRILKHELGKFLIRFEDDC